MDGLEKTIAGKTISNIQSSQILMSSSSSKKHSERSTELETGSPGFLSRLHHILAMCCELHHSLKFSHRNYFNIMSLTFTEDQYDKCSYEKNFFMFRKSSILKTNIHNPNIY